MAENPLKAYFRQPSLYLRLPSNGRWWPDGSLSLPISGELDVMSMTAADEILLQTPEALMSGEATVSLIQNCIHGIKDAWAIPSIDIESILIAIRIASISEKMSIEATCKQCKEVSHFDIDLKSHLEKFNSDLWNETLVIGDLTFTFKPCTFKQQCEHQLKLFQYQKQSKQLTDVKDYDQKEHITNSIINEIQQLEVLFIINTINNISVKGQIVTDQSFIKEFVLNADKSTVDKLKIHTAKLKEATKCNNLELMCESCRYEFKAEFSLDYSIFFSLNF
jgi:hypothetical protein